MKINQRWLNIAIAIVLLILVFCFFMLYKNSGDCLKNPFTYAAKKASTKDNKLYCTCGFTSPNYAGFSFDEDGVEIFNQ
jgi:hypothetical protein